MKLKKICILCFAGLLLFSGLVFFQHGKWDKYYKNKMGQPPRQIVVNALGLFQKPGKAIDIGCGVGNEAALLLELGWAIWAIDSEPKAIKLMTQRISSEKLSPTVAKFDKDSTWDLLPNVDLIYASYSLPFCKRKEFEEVWAHIKQHLAPNGRFAGHFFGLNYQGFSKSAMQEMTFLSREEVLDLFKDFEIESFREMEGADLSGTGRPIHSHVFEVIAQKQSVF